MYRYVRMYIYIYQTHPRIHVRVDVGHKPTGMYPDTHHCLRFHPKHEFNRQLYILSWLNFLVLHQHVWSSGFPKTEQKKSLKYHSRPMSCEAVRNPFPRYTYLAI